MITSEIAALDKKSIDENSFTVIDAVCFTVFMFTTIIIFVEAGKYFGKFLL